MPETTPGQCKPQDFRGLVACARNKAIASQAPNGIEVQRMQTTSSLPAPRGWGLSEVCRSIWPCMAMIDQERQAAQELAQVPMAQSSTIVCEPSQQAINPDGLWAIVLRLEPKLPLLLLP